MINSSINYSIKSEDYTTKATNTYLSAEAKAVTKSLVERSPPIAQLIENLVIYIGAELKDPTTQMPLLDKITIIDGQNVLDTHTNISSDQFFTTYSYRIADTLKVVLSTVVYTQVKPDTRITWSPLKETISSFSKRCKKLNMKVTQYTTEKAISAEGELLAKHFILSMIITQCQLMCFGIPPLDKSRTFTFAEAFNE